MIGEANVRQAKSVSLFEKVKIKQYI